MRAVVATDSLQIIIMFIAVVIIAIFGTYALSNITTVFSNANDGGRLIFDK